VDLQEKFDPRSQIIRRLAFGEVFELLSGPRRQPTLQTTRIKGNAVQDGATGWVTLKDLQGTENFQSIKLFECKSSIAVTAEFDSSGCEQLRKLDVGELVEQLEAPQSDEQPQISRIRVRARRDSVEGWTTITGAQGTVYLEQTTSYWTCLRGVPLQHAQRTGSTTTRLLEVGELFQVLEGPVVDEIEGEMRVRGRALRGGDTGWFPMAEGVRLWWSRHRCVHGAPLHEDSNPSSSVLRMLTQGEMIEAINPPCPEQAATGQLRLRVRCDQDGMVGFTSMVAPDGLVYLESVVTGD